MNTINSAVLVAPRRSIPLIAFRWLARLLSVASVGIILMFAFGEGTPSGRDWLLLAFFPHGDGDRAAHGVVAEVLGGTIAVGSVAVFLGLMLVLGGRVPAGGVFCDSGGAGGRSSSRRERGRGSARTRTGRLSRRTSGLHMDPEVVVVLGDTPGQGGVEEDRVAGAGPGILQPAGDGAPLTEPLERDARDGANRGSCT